jgi:hypothetical protein
VPGLWRLALSIGILGFGLFTSVVIGLWLRYVPNQTYGPLRTTIDKRGPVRLFFLGDTGSGNESQIAVGEAMEKRCLEVGGIDGLVLLGDLFYMQGVTAVADKQWQEKIERPYGQPCLSRAKIYPVLGNHDYRGDPGVLIDYSTVNPRWQMPHRFYSIDFPGIMRIVFGDSPVSDFCFLPDICSVDFILDSLATASFPWKVVAVHHPLASASVKGYSHSGGIYGFLAKPLVCSKVDVWLSGHAHHLEHRREPGCAADIVVAGGGGGELNGIEEGQPESLFARSTNGFGELVADKDRLIVQLRDRENQVLHEFARDLH